MALDINGYNSVFRNFIKFAQDNANVGDETAIASAKIQKEPLQGRKIVSVTNSLTDEVHKWMRTNDEYAVNDRHEIPGFEALVNRDMTSGLYTSLLLHSYGHDMVHDLIISEDGTTATIVQTHEAELDAPESARDDANYFGKVTFTQKLVIDLTPDIPVVTDYKLSQTIE